MDCPPGANGNGAESFKKTSEINLFATDEHQPSSETAAWQADGTQILQKLKEAGRFTPKAFAS